ncbi:two-component regulator propeller domain-containing protein [uncultured Parabacteroides sp.]|uniref:ligand-binding sensor domain-containing protein n=1 Tax=uncultured Parabacteroides sp. TaxID=512312 RepID=UPI0025E0128A|nr:two-component regulator propeller domain-containing protein [uncultured Parabacteroides sp.]
MKQIPLLIITLLSLLRPLGGLAEELHFRHYNNKQGLSHNTVYCSLQDKRGFMWFGTEDGLNRFDGHTFKVYRHNSYNPNSLPGDHLNFLFESSDERIWICTSAGTCYYDHKTDTFHPFHLSSAQNEPESFSAVTEDKNQQLWFIRHNRIVRYNPTDSSTRVYPAEKNFYPNLITLTNEGEPLFSNGQALYTYKTESDAFLKTELLTEQQIGKQISIQAIRQVPELGILVGTNLAGLLLYNYQDQSVTTIIPDIQVRAITPYNNSTYWIASESGIYIYNVLSREVINLRKSLTNEYTIADNAIYSITKDREGGMWAGSFFGGISYLPKEYTRFNHFIGGKTHPQLPGNAIREIVPDQYGNLWLGTEDNGINCYNPSTGQITNYSYNNPQHPLSATNIHGLLADGNRLWVALIIKGSMFWTFLLGKSSNIIHVKVPIILSTTTLSSVSIKPATTSS